MAKIEGILFGCDGVLIDKHSGFAIKNIQQTLQSLQKTPKAVCSNNFIEDIEFKLSNINIKQYMQVLVSSGERPKPHPEVFLKAAAGLRANIFSCLVIEDSIIGLKAALASGAITVAYAPTEQMQEELNALRPEFIITDMNELIDLYNNLNEE